MTMVETAFDAELNAMRSRIEPLEKLVHAFAGSLPAPLHYHSGQEHYGVRFGKPDVRHFCLLKAVRVVSALNAAITLARGGYTQEIGVLMRILIECTTHIEFVLDCRDEGGVLEPAADKYIKDYFSDFARGPDGGLRGFGSIRYSADEPSTPQPGAPATDNQHYRGPAAKAPDVRFCQVLRPTIAAAMLGFTGGSA